MDNILTGVWLVPIPLQCAGSSFSVTWTFISGATARALSLWVIGWVIALQKAAYHYTNSRPTYSFVV